MKLVGEALKSNYQIQKKDQIKLLGIVYWNTLKDKETLLKAEQKPVRFHYCRLCQNQIDTYIRIQGDI